MGVKLYVSNPSNYPRRGHICVALRAIQKKIGRELKNIIVYDQQQRVLPSQVHITDPANPSDGDIIVSLISEVSPGSKEYIIIDSNNTGHKQPSNELGLEIHLEPKGCPRGATLHNNRLKVFFNFIPKIDFEWQHWYAGSATSVLLEGEEFLDFADWLRRDHDPEKRCMQLDQIKVPYSAWEPDFCQQIELFNRPYRLVSESCGQVCARFAIASKPFLHNYSDPVTKKKGVFLCELYRIISLYADADYFIEELYIKGRPIKNPADPDSLTHELFETGQLHKKVNNANHVKLWFTGRYFMYMNMHFDPQIHQFEGVPDWLAIGCRHSPYPGYGFATDIHVNKLENPHKDFPLPDRDKSFSLELCPCKSAKCLHLFMHSEQTSLDSRIGNLWYELIYKPLKIKI